MALRLIWILRRHWIKLSESCALWLRRLLPVLNFLLSFISEWQLLYCSSSFPDEALFFFVDFTFTSVSWIATPWIWIGICFAGIIQRSFGITFFLNRLMTWLFFILQPWFFHLLLVLLHGMLMQGNFLWFTARRHLILSKKMMLPHCLFSWLRFL